MSDLSKEAELRKQLISHIDQYFNCNLAKENALIVSIMELTRSRERQIEAAAQLRQRAYDDQEEQKRVTQLEQRVLEANKTMVAPEYLEWHCQNAYEKALDDYSTKLKGVFNHE